MGAADIFFESLLSKEVRKNVPNGGTRVVNTKFEEQEEDGNWVWNAGKKIVGSIFGAIGGFLTFTISALWGILTSAIGFIWNFDWNQSDESIDQKIKQKWAALGGMLGGTLGNLVGFLGCGVLPGALIFSINEPLGALIIENATEELAEEFIGNVTQLARYTLQSTVETILLWGYKSVRKIINSPYKTIRDIAKNNKGIQALLKANGVTIDWDSPNKKPDVSNKPWSFALKVEEAIESIPNDFIRNFVEEFGEEATESCVEAGYVVANSLDTYFAAEKLKQQLAPPLGKTKYVEITPNRDNQELKIVLAGPQQTLKQEIVSTLTNYQVMSEKDIGVVYNFEPEKILSRKHKPQIVLYFQETKQSFADRRKNNKKTSRGEGRISFRLMDKTTESINMDFITQLANRVKGKFGKPPLQWHKGKLLYSYTDWEKGYQLQLLANSENEALRIVEQVLDLQSHSVDREKMQQVRNLAPEKAYDNTPKKKNILGKQVEPPVRRKEVTVQFLYAQLFIEGNLHPITLYDKSKRYRSPVVRDNT
jgi:hypothetical protein